MTLTPTSPFSWPHQQHQQQPYTDSVHLTRALSSSSSPYSSLALTDHRPHQGGGEGHGGEGTTGSGMVKYPLLHQQHMAGSPAPPMAYAANLHAIMAPPTYPYAAASPPLTEMKTGQQPGEEMQQHHHGDVVAAGEERQEQDAQVTTTDKVGEWIVHWFDEERRGQWKLCTPRIKSCKKKKCQYSPQFDDIMYKSPYKYHLNMAIENMAVAEGEKIYAVMDLNYENGASVVYHPPEGKAKKQSARGNSGKRNSNAKNKGKDSATTTSSEDGEPKSLFHSSGVISNNEQQFQQGKDGGAADVTVGPIQFNTCSYKQDNRKFRILVFVLSTLMDKSVCCLISPPLLIRAKKPIAQPGSKKKAAEMAKKKLKGALDVMAEDSQSSSSMSSVEVSPSPGSLKRKRESATFPLSQPETPPTTLPFQIDTASNNIIFTNSSNAHASSHSDLSNELEYEPMAKQWKMQPGEASPGNAIFSSNNLIGSSSSSSSSSGGNYNLDDFINRLSTLPSVVEQQEQAFRNLPKQNGDASSSSSGVSHPSNDTNASQSNMTGEEKVQSVMDLFRDMLDNDRKNLLDMIVNSLSNVEREYVARKYFGESASSSYSQSMDHSYATYESNSSSGGSSSGYGHSNDSNNNNPSNDYTADSSLDELFGQIFN